MLWTCYGKVVNLVRTYYGETGVLEFDLKTAAIVASVDEALHNIMLL